MTPKPDNLPAPADMDLATLLREMALVLHNAGGDERGAGYSAKLADAAMKWADDLPGWKPIETAIKIDGQTALVWVRGWHVAAARYCEDGAGFNEDQPGWYLAQEDVWLKPSHWYDFGGSPMPPEPEGGE